MTDKPDPKRTAAHLQMGQKPKAAEKPAPKAAEKAAEPEAEKEETDGEKA